MTALPEPVDLLGVNIHPITREHLVETLVDWAVSGDRKRAYYVNAHAMNLAYEQSDFRKSLNGADVVYCDGFGVKWGARLRGLSLPDRMTPPDWIDDFLDGIGSSTPIYLLGDEPGIAAQCGGVMRERHRGLQVAGSHHGYFDTDVAAEADLLERIRTSGAAVLLVGMGMPKQEYWIDKNLASLPVTVAISVGALFGYYSGMKWRSPAWMTDHGLEWLGRQVTQPIRMQRRYLVGNPLFVTRVLRSRGQ